VQLSTGFLASRRAITMLELLGNGEICSCWPLQLRRPATQYAAPINDNLVWGLFEDARRGRNSSIYSLGSDISLTIKPLALTTHPTPTHSFLHLRLSLLHSSCRLLSLHIQDSLNHHPTLHKTLISTSINNNNRQHAYRLLR
jgi:hypothetical protein